MSNREIWSHLKRCEYQKSCLP